MKGLLPVVFFLLLLLGGLLLLHGDNSSGAGGSGQNPGPGNACNYGFSKTVKIVDDSLGVNAYIALYYHDNGTLAGFEVRYDYNLPRPMSGGTGWIEAEIDGTEIYNGPPVDRIDIPSQYEDGEYHEVTVIYRCR